MPKGGMENKGNSLSLNFSVSKKFLPKLLNLGLEVPILKKWEESCNFEQSLYLLSEICNFCCLPASLTHARRRCVYGYNIWLTAV